MSLKITARAVMAGEKDPLAITARKMRIISKTTMYPLRFEPIYQYRLWGGRRLAHLLTTPLPGDGPVGEARILSDRDDH